MATEKPRINITTEPATHKAVTAAAKRAGVPVATKAAELLEIGLSLEEDLYFNELVMQRLRKKGKFVSHEDAWK